MTPAEIALVSVQVIMLALLIVIIRRVPILYEHDRMNAIETLAAQREARRVREAESRGADDKTQRSLDVALVAIVHDEIAGWRRDVTAAMARQTNSIRRSRVEMAMLAVNTSDSKASAIADSVLEVASGKAAVLAEAILVAADAEEDKATTLAMNLVDALAVEQDKATVLAGAILSALAIEQHKAAMLADALQEAERVADDKAETLAREASTRDARLDALERKR